MTTTVAAQTTRKIGDKVTVDSAKFPGVWTVTKINKVNLVLDQAGRKLTASPWVVKDANATASATVTTVPVPEYFHAGEIVRINAGRFVGLYAVLKDNGDKVNLAKLGGDNGRYVRMPKTGGIVRVDVADILK